ncbi:MAG: hypothetical protein ACM3QX_15430 [Syntrophomonadaceae bacterium]
MRAFSVPVIIAFILAGSCLCYGEQDARLDLKQLVRNQIDQIKARGNKPESALVDEKNPSAVNKTPNDSHVENASLKNEKSLAEKTPQTKAPAVEKVFLKSGPPKKDDGLFLKVFVLVDLSLLAALFVYWRRRKLKIGMAEKVKFKKNITKLRSEGKFRRNTKSQSDKVRKRLQYDPACDLEDDALLRKHAKKISVPSGELMLAQRLRAFEKAHE